MAPAQMVQTPHFDQESLQSARPAVPLARIRARRLVQLALFFVGAGLVGAVMGLAYSQYQNKSGQRPSSPPSIASGQMPSQSYEKPSQPVAADERAKDSPALGSDANAERQTSAPQSDNHAPDGDGEAVAPERDARAALRAALEKWIAATNARDLNRQMGFYSQTVSAFYLTRNVRREAVRAEKSRVFSHAEVIDIKAAAPDIRLSNDGRTATIRFRKKYAISGGGEDRSGEVVQELRWVRTADGWKIVSERDLRVIH